MNLLNETPFESGSKLVDSMLKNCHKYVISQTSVQVMEKKYRTNEKKKTIDLWVVLKHL